MKNEQIVFREEGEGAFLFDPVTGNLKYLNQSAREIYLMIDGSKEPADLVGGFADIYPDPDRDKIAKDLEAFLKDLTDNRFIVAIDGETE